MSQKVIDATPLQQVLKGLSKITGLSQEEVMYSEATAILKRAMERTGPNLTRAKARLKARYTPITEGGTREFIQRSALRKFDDMEPGRVFWSQREGGFRTRRKDNPEAVFTVPSGGAPSYANIRAYLADKHAKRTQRLGLSKATWLALAEQMGLNFDTPAEVRNRLADARKLVSVERITSEANFTVTLLNNTRLIPYTGMVQAIQSAIDGRLKYLEKNVATGVFYDVEQILSAYPGLKFARDRL